METVKEKQMEKLVELLQNADEYCQKECEEQDYCSDCPFNGANCGDRQLANYLIQNGVTLKEWVSVDEPPKEE